VGHNGRGVNKTLDDGAMLTRDILFGMNLLTLAGFAVMGLSLTLPHGSGWRAFVHRADVGRDSFGISWALCGQRVKVRASRRLSAAGP
jgi:hypothetical protein